MKDVEKLYDHEILQNIQNGSVRTVAVQRILCGTLPVGALQMFLLHS